MNVIIEAYNKGYRVVNGVLYNPNGNIINGSITPDGYISTRITKYGNTLFIHRLVAYQKFGDAMFDKGIEARHLDNNSLNNFDNNIAIGSHSDNMMDKPKEVRIKCAKYAASHIRKFTDKQEQAIKKFHNETKSYKQTMETFGISSKGSLYYILKKSNKSENSS